MKNLYLTLCLFSSIILFAFALYEAMFNKNFSEATFLLLLSKVSFDVYAPDLSKSGKEE